MHKLIQRFAFFLLGLSLACSTAVIAQTGIPTIVQRLTVRGALTLPTGATITLPSASIADSALSSNVPLKNAANTFTGEQTVNLTGATLGAWNTTNADGGYVRVQRSGVTKFYLGDSKAINSGTLDDFELYTAGGIVLTPNGGRSVYIKGVNVDDYARLSQSNTFTNPTQTIQGSGAGLYLNDSAGNLNATLRLQDNGTTKAWIALVNADGQVCTGSLTDDICIAGAGRLTYGPNSGASSVDMTPSTGTFNVTWEDGCSTTPSQSWRYYKIGKAVTVQMEANVSCTGDSTGMADTGGDVPSAIRPNAKVCQAGIGMLDNTADTTGNICFATDGTVAMSKCSGTNGKCGNNFTASGTRFIDWSGATGTTQLSWVTP